MKKETLKRVAINLRMLRVNKGMSQIELADKTGVSRSMYAQYEKANRNPDAEFLYDLSKIFGIRMDLFFEIEPDKFISEVVYNEICDNGDRELINIFRRLTPFSKGKLLERAAALEEQDQIKENQLRIFQDRYIQQKGRNKKINSLMSLNHN